MATREQIEQALIKADQAGNTDDAKELAQMLRDLQQEEKPSKQDAQPQEQPQTTNTDDGFSFGEMVSNIPSSAGKFIGDVANSVIHPADTANAIQGLISGFSNKAGRNIANAAPEGLRSAGVDVYNTIANIDVPLIDIPGLPDKPVQTDQSGKILPHPDEAAADAAVNFYSDRYGSGDAAINTVEKDPVGALADLSVLLSGGGMAASKIPGLAKAGGAVSKAGALTNPANLIASGVRLGGQGVAKALPKTLPHTMYAKAAKFSTQLSPAERARISETSLKHKILPNQAGAEKALGMMRDLETQVEGLISQATKSGKTIPKKAVYKYLSDVRKKAGGVKIEGSKDLSQIEKVVKNFDEHLKKMGKDSITPDELQGLKRDIYKRVNYAEAYGKAKAGRDEARKAIARGAKESIEDVAPGVKELNKDYGDLVELIKPLTRSANRLQNNNVINIDAPLKMIAGESIGGGLGQTVGIGSALLENAAVRSRLAQGLYNAQRQRLAEALSQPGAMTSVIQGMHQAGRLQGQ